MTFDLLNERRKLIDLELRALGVCATDTFNMFDKLVDTCYQVMAATPHENRLPSTGVMLFSDFFEDYQLKERHEFIRVKPPEEALCWSLADGIHSFVTKDPKGLGLLILEAPVVDELSLFTFRDDLLFFRDDPTAPPTRECLIVQRAAGRSSRRVTILARERIVTSSGLAFMSKPYQYDILTALRSTIKPFPWKDYPQTLRSALRLSVHKFSPENHGATFIILSPADLSKSGGRVKFQNLILDQAISPSKFPLVKRAYQLPLVHLMKQRDGAATISPKGDVVNVGAFFRSIGKNIKRGGATLSGTRHRSAAEFSRQIDGITIVTSSDGPVTIYRKGKALEIPQKNLLMHGGDLLPKEIFDSKSTEKSVSNV